MDKGELMEMARFAEQTDRYEDMYKYMKQVVELGEKLDVSERNLLSVAYKNAVGVRRAAWRVVVAIEQRKDSVKPEIVQEYRKEIEKELSDVCDEVLNLLDSHLIKKDDDDESQVFFLKMKGDYYRYVAEVKSGDARDDTISKSQEAYQAAFTASQNMKPTHPIRLGLALNYSVFLYEILNDSAKACTLAKELWLSDDAAEPEVEEDDS
ncbi:14-3-3 protein zeta-like [Diretmus argenteus]